MRQSLFRSAVALALVLSPVSAWADGQASPNTPAGNKATGDKAAGAKATWNKPTWKDRIDQVFATFMGDPAAGVDIDMKHVLDTWRGMHPKPLEKLSPEDARRQPSPIQAAADLARKHDTPLGPLDVAVTQTSVPDAAGAMRPMKVFTPTAARTGAPLPVVVFLHGGGFVLDNSAGSDASARAIAAPTGAIVVTPDYRLAPEHKFPAAQEDAFAAYRWVLENAASFGGDPARIALAGEGAGGLLAIDTAIKARDEKLPRPAALVLIVPAAGTDLKTNSWLEDSAARPWNKAAVQWALGLYFATPDDNASPLIDVIGKASVEGLPPTTIVTAEIDPLRSDGERLGGKLRRATVSVEMRDYPGVTHDFFGMGGIVQRAAMAQNFVAARLKAAFAPPAEDTIALKRLGVAPYPEAPDPATSPTAATVPNIPASQPMNDKK